jgi:glycosidase
VSGFRIDAAPFVIEATPGDTGEQADDPHEFLRTIREFVNRRRGDAILLAEANLPMDEQRRFFGDEGGDEMHMIFDFTRNQRMFLSLVRQDARPLADWLGRLPKLPNQCQWAVFVKNHDELTLDKLSEEEREEVFAALAPDESMRSFGRGIRRRVPPMLDGDRRRIKLLYSLVLSQPGTPVLLYGEEIGLGDNQEVPGRGAVRVPMQWTADPNAGFTGSGGADEAHRPAGGEYGPKQVNVQAQRHDSDSLLNWMERTIRLRKELPELGIGTLRVLDTGDEQVLAHRCDWRGRVVIALHNFSGEERRVTLPDHPGDDPDASLSDLTADQDYDPPERGGELRLGPFGYRWMRLTS